MLDLLTISSFVVAANAAGRSYITVKQDLTAYDAEAYCQSNYGSSLATIIDADDIAAYTSSLNGAGVGSSGRGCWIGLHDDTSEGTFEWNDGTTCTVYGSYNQATMKCVSYWNGGEPNDVAYTDVNGDSPGEDCVHAWISGSSIVANDLPCAWTSADSSYKEQCFTCNAAPAEGRQYAAYSGTYTPDQAAAQCAAKHGTELATVVTMSDIATFITEIDSAGVNDCWIGLRDDASEGTFDWDDGSSQCSNNGPSNTASVGCIEFWNGSGEPNNSGGEDCTHVWKSNLITGLKANDLPCTNTRGCYVCNVDDPCASAGAALSSDPHHCECASAPGQTFCNDIKYVSKKVGAEISGDGLCDAGDRCFCSCPNCGTHKAWV